MSELGGALEVWNGVSEAGEVGKFVKKVTTPGNRGIFLTDKGNISVQYLAVNTC